MDWNGRSGQKLERNGEEGTERERIGLAAGQWNVQQSNRADGFVMEATGKAVTERNGRQSRVVEQSVKERT